MGSILANFRYFAARLGLLLLPVFCFALLLLSSFALQTVTALAWEDSPTEQKRFPEYLANTDLIMKYDLQENIGQLLLVGRE